jgi:hypothetical protein
MNLSATWWRFAISMECAAYLHLANWLFLFFFFLFLFFVISVLIISRSLYSGRTTFHKLSQWIYKTRIIITIMNILVKRNYHIQPLIGVGVVRTRIGVVMVVVVRTRIVDMLMGCRNVEAVFGNPNCWDVDGCHKTDGMLMNMCNVLGWFWGMCMDCCIHVIMWMNWKGYSNLIWVVVTVVVLLNMWLTWTQPRVGFEYIDLMKENDWKWF